MKKAKKGAKGKRHVKRRAERKQKPKEKREALPVGELPAPEWAGLDSLDSMEEVQKFVTSVEEAFRALHQPAAEPEWLHREGEPVSPTQVGTWARSVEDRLDTMGLNHVATGFPEVSGGVAGTAVDGNMMVKWTRRVWARFAALGQIIAR